MTRPRDLPPAITSGSLTTALDRLGDGVRLPDSDPEVTHFRGIERLLSDDPAEYTTWLNRLAAERLSSQASVAHLSSLFSDLMWLMNSASLAAYACAEAMQICLSDLMLIEDLERCDVPSAAVSELRDTLLEQSLDLVGRLIRNMVSRARVSQEPGGHGDDGVRRLRELDDTRSETVIRGHDQPTDDQPTLVVLTAGRGTRLRSTIPKGLIPVRGVPMISRIIEASSESGIENRAFVLKFRAGVQEEYLSRSGRVLVQDSAEGTGHSAFFALHALRGTAGPVLFSFSDQPFLVRESFERLLARASSAALVVSAFSPAQPDTGRVVRDPGGRVARIGQPRLGDAASAEGDGGLYLMGAGPARKALGNLRNDNVRREFNLPDVAAELTAAGHRVDAVLGPAGEFQSVNTPGDLLLAQLRAAGASGSGTAAPAFLARYGWSTPPGSPDLSPAIDRIMSLIGPVLDLRTEEV
jgi:GTP:adenosylcobinamide-phosphate guanylyltransferase